MSRKATTLNPQVRAEATEWLLRFSEQEADAAAREEFNAWLRASPEHVRAYLRICAFWQEADRIESEPRDLGALIELARGEKNVFSLGLRPGLGEAGAAPAGVAVLSPATAMSARRRPLLALAASLLLAFGIGAFWYSHHVGSHYSTGTGEQRTVNLPDGSSVVINALSSVKVAYTDTERAIELREGQALFRVARNPARPFIVRSGDASIRAVGTTFDVYRKRSGTVVTVVEGKVAVREKASEALLVAGEQLTITHEAIAPPKPARLAEATAWTAGLLVFDGAPLSEVVSEFNRQNSRPLVLSDAELAALRISGTFPASGSERIVRFLEERFDVVVHESDDEIRISRP